MKNSHSKLGIFLFTVQCTLQERSAWVDALIHNTITPSGHYLRAPRNVVEQTMGHCLVVPWLLDADVLPKLEGRDDGGRHPITI